MKQISFGVKSRHLSIYKAFKEELEEIGYTWNADFNSFSRSRFENTTCVFVSNGWGYEPGKPQMSFSNPSSNSAIYDLDAGMFTEAIEHARKEYERVTAPKYIEVELNSEYTAKVYEDKIVVGCQTILPFNLRILLEATREMDWCL